MDPSLGLPTLPILSGGGCPGGSLDPACSIVAGGAASLVGDGAGAVLSALASGVISGGSWLLGQIGGVLSAASSVDLGASWFGQHYTLMLDLAAAVLLPAMLLAVMQAVYRQSAAVLVRTALVNLPLALLLGGVAVQLTQLALSATDAMSSSVASLSGADVQQALAGLASVLLSEAGDPTVPSFVLLLGGLLVVAGALALWLELLVRAAAVYLAVLFVPLGLASLAWPAISHWCRRLLETLAALILSKLVIVAALSLAVGELGAGSSSGFDGVLGGGAMLLLASFTPFVLLRLIPVVEAGAVHQLEGTRQRVTRTVTAPKGAAAHALAGMRAESLELPMPGTGAAPTYEAPGGPAAPGGPPDAAPSASGDSPSAPGRSTTPGGSPQAVPWWGGEPASDRAFAEVLARGGAGAERRRADYPAPVASRADAADARPRHGAGAGAGATMGRHVIDHDELGPVVRWLPAGPGEGSGTGEGDAGVSGSSRQREGDTG